MRSTTAVSSSSVEPECSYSIITYVHSSIKLQNSSKRALVLMDRFTYVRLYLNITIPILTQASWLMRMNARANTCAQQTAWRGECRSQRRGSNHWREWQGRIPRALSREGCQGDRTGLQQTHLVTPSINGSTSRILGTYTLQAHKVCGLKKSSEILPRSREIPRDAAMLLPPKVACWLYVASTFASRPLARACSSVHHH